MWLNKSPQKPFTPEFLKWSLPSLNLDKSIVENRSFSLNSVDPDEMNSYEQSCLDLHPWQRHLHWSARLKRLIPSIWTDKPEQAVQTWIRWCSLFTTHSAAGPSSSKLRMSLVNISLKLWSLNMAYTLIFLLKKCEQLLHLQKLLTFFLQKYLWIRYCTY